MRMSQLFGSSIHREFEREASRSATDQARDELADKELKGEAARQEMGDGLEEESPETDDAEKEWIDEYSGDRGFAQTAHEQTAGQTSEHFAEAENNIYDPLEMAAAGALNAEDSGEFFGRLFSRLRLAARSTGPAVSLAGTVKAAESAKNRGVGQTSRMSSENAAIVMHQILPLLRQYAAYGCDEREALEDLADWFAEEESFALLPVLGAMAARTLVRPLIRRAGTRLTQPEACMLVRAATQAARMLIRSGGAQAICAMPDITRRVLRTALRQRLPVKALPDALRRAATEVGPKSPLQQRDVSPSVAVDPQLAGQRVIRLDTPQRFQITGPVEITIVRLKGAGE
jgi:hypothetical protein